METFTNRQLISIVFLVGTTVLYVLALHLGPKIGIRWLSGFIFALAGITLVAFPQHFEIWEISGAHTFEYSIRDKRLFGAAILVAGILLAVVRKKTEQGMSPPWDDLSRS